MKLHMRIMLKMTSHENSKAVAGVSTSQFSKIAIACTSLEITVYIRGSCN